MRKPVSMQAIPTENYFRNCGHEGHGYRLIMLTLMRELAMRSPTGRPGTWSAEHAVYEYLHPHHHQARGHTLKQGHRAGAHQQQQGRGWQERHQAV